VAKAARTAAAVLAAVALLGPVPAGADTGVALSGNRYLPKEVVVKAGDTVVWTNQDDAGHSVTADDGSFDSHPGCSDSGGSCLPKGGTFKVMFAKAGRYAYYCRVHGGPGGSGMAGTVTVAG